MTHAPAPQPAIPTTASLQAKGLVKKYGGHKVVDGVDFLLNPGEIVALLGPNGAGKTTSFYMMVGFIRPNAGRIYLGKQAITSWPMYKRARAGLGYLAQEPSAFRKMSVVDNLISILEFQKVKKSEHIERAMELLDEFSLGPPGAAPRGYLVGWRAAAAGNRAEPHHQSAVHPARRTLYRR